MPAAPSAVVQPRDFLRAVGYGAEALATEYPVWRGLGKGTARLDLIAFGRPGPRDMSSAVVTVSTGSIDDAYDVAQLVAAPYFIVTQDQGPDLWVAAPSGPVMLEGRLTGESVERLRDLLRPATALAVKVGLRQLPLFDTPVDLLATATARRSDQLTPLVTEALAAAHDALPRPARERGEAAMRREHRRAARLVVGSLTALVMRDQSPAQAGAFADPLALVQQEHPSTFEWLAKTTARERTVLRQLISQLGEGINYESLDPSILSKVYETALVDDDERRQLGIHYTPPELARRLVADLPVELIPPHDRHVLDPACGSGTLLIAVHDRLRDLQPATWADERRHEDLAVHLHGYDVDPFAVEIARLSLLLHAQPAGNGWQIDERDTLTSPHPSPRPKIIATNPPWLYTSADGQRTQVANDFLRWGLRALGPGGLLAIVLPASFLTAKNSAEIRAELQATSETFEVWKLPEGTFASSQQAPCVLMARRRDGKAGVGARVVREIDQPGLSPFLLGSASQVTYVEADAGDDLRSTPPAPKVKAATVPLSEIALILSGPQPKQTIADRRGGVPYLNHIGDIPAYGIVSEEHLWRVHFPDDFQNGRGQRIIRKRKVLASAARSSSSPWRFHVAIDTEGIAVRNSVRGIAPLDQNDDDLLFAIALIVGSGFASTFAAAIGGDRNIPARTLNEMPFPTERQTIARLATLGRQATDLAAAPDRLNNHLIAAEEIVWDAYGVAPGERAAAEARLGGHAAPEGLRRYPRKEPADRGRRSSFRRVGTVLAVDGSVVRLWINGVTPEAGLEVELPPYMPGWLVRPGASFDVTDVLTKDDVSTGRFVFQQMAWRDLDFAADEPRQLVARSERDR